MIYDFILLFEVEQILFIAKSNLTQAYVAIKINVFFCQQIIFTIKQDRMINDLMLLFEVARNTFYRFLCGLVN